MSTRLTRGCHAIAAESSSAPIAVRKPAWTIVGPCRITQVSMIGTDGGLSSVLMVRPNVIATNRRTVGAAFSAPQNSRMNPVKKARRVSP